MSESQEGTNATGGTPPPATSPYTFLTDLKSDGKSIMNQAVWNMALLYPFYMYNLDRQYFNQYDGDVVSAAKLGGLIAGVTEGQKLLRKTLVQAGVNEKVAYPFGRSV